jgi:type II secretory pathway component PulC
MLQNTPDTPEPESPYEIYESTVSLSSEQRSPVVQQIAEDPQAIFNQVMMWTV